MTIVYNFPFRYRCSLCGALLEPEDVRAHADEHRASPDWAGTMSFTREDRTTDEPD